MDTQNLLDKLQIKDKSIIFDFVLGYSRFEYALKRARYCRGRKNDVEVNWELFIKHIRDDFDPGRSQELHKAVSYLLEHPTQSQELDENGSLKFGDHPSTQDGPVALRVYHSIRIARNNLFHGGKFPGPDGRKDDIGRDEGLLRSSLIVLEEFLNLNSEVSNFFYEGPA